MNRKHIFLSSVFDEKTLHSRAVFRNEINARLNFIAGRLGENIYLYDFEMGIPSQFTGEDQSQYATRVLYTCLDKIKKSQYFIFILGKKYGTVITDPQEGLLKETAKYLIDEFSDVVSEGIREGLSVLELELKTAVSTDGLQCIFCVDTDENTVASSDTKIVKLQQLVRQESKKRGNKLIEYSSCEKNLQGLKNGIITAFEEIYGGFVQENELNPDEQKQFANHNLLYANKSRYYVRNEPAYDFLNRYITNDNRQCLCLHGVSGNGKSSLIANWSKDSPLLKEMHLISFYAGTEGSSVFEMLHQVYFSNDFLNEDDKNESSEEELLEMFYDFLLFLSTNYKKTVVLIDGVNQLSSKGEYDKYVWLPPNMLPANVKLIFSTSEIDLLSQKNILFYEVPKIDLLKIVEHTFLLEGKENEYERLIREDSFRFSFNDINNPMIARLFCQEVIMSLSFKDMKLYHSNEDTSKKLLADYLSVLSDTSRSETDRIKKLYIDFLERLDEHFNKKLFRSMLSFIWGSYEGFTVEELAALCDGRENYSSECLDNIQEIYYTMYHEFSHDANGRILFYHDYIKGAIEANVSKNTLDNSKKLIIDTCFTRYKTNEVALFELVHQLISHDDFAEKSNKTRRLFEDYYAAIALYKKNKNLLLQCISIVQNKPGLFDLWKPSYAENILDDELFLCGRIVNRLGFYKKALEWYLESLAIREKTPGEQIDIAATYNNIADVYDSKKEYPKAIEWYQKDLAILEKLLGKEHPHTAITYNNMALVYHNQGEYAKALEWFQKGLAIHEKLLGKEHPDTATIYNNMALVYLDQGEYAKALKWFQKDLAITEKILGKEHPNTAIAYNNVALVYSHQGENAKALEWYEKALTICEKVLGKEHPDTATAYYNVADVYKNQGDYLKALKWFQKALAIREKVLGKEHPSTAITYNNMALIYHDQGEYAKALEWYEKVLVIFEKVLGKEHLDTGKIYNNIALVYKNQRDYPNALEWYQKDLTISEKVLGKEHPDIATAYYNIAGIYDSQGEYAKALELYEKALVVLEKVLSKEQPDTATFYTNIAGFYESHGEYAKALEWYQKALAIYEKVLGKEHPDTVATYNNIAAIYKKQGA